MRKKQKKSTAPQQCLQLLLQPKLQRFSYTGVWTNMSSYPNKQTHKAVGKVVYPTQTKTRMKGQKARQHVRDVAQSPAISSEKVQGRKKYIIIQTLTVTTELVIPLFFCRAHYATLYIQVCSQHQRKVRVETGFKKHKEQNQPTRSHLGTLIQSAGFWDVHFFL